MRYDINRATMLLFAMVTFLPYSNVAQAGLHGQVTYSSCYFLDNQCQSSYLTDTSSTNSPVSVGDSYGGASAQSNYGVLDASASSSWIPAGPPYENYSTHSFGHAYSHFDDTLTVSGGTGNVQVTFTVQLNGGITGGVAGSGGQGNISAGIYIDGGQQQANLDLMSTSGNNVVSVVGPNATWVSENGSFTAPGGDLLNPPSANGTLTWVASVPYDTPVSILVQLIAIGGFSGASNAHATVKLFVPGGTTVSSASGVNYAVAPANASVPMLPTVGFWILLGVLGLIGVVFSKSKSFN